MKKNGTKKNMETKETLEMDNLNCEKWPGLIQKDSNLQKLIEQLQKILRIEKQDATFGIYRLLNEIRVFLTHFLQVDLINFIEKLFTQYLPVTTIKTAESSTMLQEQLLNTILTRLYLFFKRYYQAGDFSPQRAYTKNERYFITAPDLQPYFYWINQDQYYVKSDRYFRDFSFKAGKYQIQFKIVDFDPAINNNKLENAFFLLDTNSEPIIWNEGEKTLIVRLQFKRLSLEEQESLRKAILSHQKEFKANKETNVANYSNTVNNINTANISNTVNNTNTANAKKSKDIEIKLTQALIFQDIQATIFDLIPLSNQDLQQILADRSPFAKNESLLLSKLHEMTSKSNTDFFIHQNLEEYLLQELSFYLSNENEPGLEMVEKIAQYIIKTLGLLENLKRKLWLKKKWVYKTEYFLTLDKVPLSLMSQVLDNSKQITEWTTLLGFNPMKNLAKATSERAELSRNIQSHFPFLWIDTRLFDSEFKDSIIESFPNLDHAIDGVLLKGDNFQALRLISTRYHHQIDGLYIDPPYNTGGDEFVYKDRFEHSCWLSLMQQTLLQYKNMMSDHAQFFISIDDNEVSHLGLLCDKIFGSNYARNHIIVRSNPIGRTYLDIYKNHEYIVYGNVDRKIKEKAKQKIEGKFEGKVDGKVDIITGCPKTSRFGSLWDEKDVRTENGTKRLNSLFENVPIQHPKPIELIQKCIKLVESQQGLLENTVFLDFFAGSGSTAHAILDLVYQDSIRRKYILIEMADYFEHLIIPRIKKIMFARQWTKQQPNMDSENMAKNGQSHFVKYYYIEQYDDALNNTEISYKGNSPQDSDAKGYRLEIDVETKNIAFKMRTITDINDYQLLICQKGEYINTPIDLIESLNLMIGLHVISIQRWQHANICYKMVYGWNNNGKYLIIWRFSENDEQDWMHDETALQEYITMKYEYSHLLINGETKISNAERIELRLKQLMEASVDER